MMIFKNLQKTNKINKKAKDNQFFIKLVMIKNLKIQKAFRLLKKLIKINKFK